MANNEPTNHTKKFSPCIDLIFASLSSLHENCHHQIIYAKFNLKIYYLLPYQREVWHYQKENIESIRKLRCQFPWAMRFTNTDVNEKVNLFNKTIENII